MANLAPVFQMPRPVRQETGRALPEYRAARAFDFEVGDFVVDATGRVETVDGYEAWAVWTVKAVLTERMAHLLYTPRYGCDYRRIRAAQSRAEAEGEARLAISQALKADPRTHDVVDFAFSGQGDELFCSFTVIPAVGTRKRITVRLTV